MVSPDTLSGLCDPCVSADAEILMLGGSVDQLKEYWQNAHTTTPSGLIRRYELAILINPQTLKQSPPVPQLLAVARDQWARQVVVLLDQQLTHPLPETDFYALGYNRRPLSPPLSDRFDAYGFSISNYKTTPDWFNSRFWANPERWNKR